jgi:fructose-bisphosphate aldolase class I
MTAAQLVETARLLAADGRGLLAMDESNGACDKRFTAADIAPGAEARRRYRELLITTPGLNTSISGVILYDETIRQTSAKGIPFVKLLTDAGIMPGIKVDTGAKKLALHDGEMVTEGLDGLRTQLHEYRQIGALPCDPLGRVMRQVSLTGNSSSTSCPGDPAN